MKRSIMPIMALAFAFATFVTVVTPASACGWGVGLGGGTTAGNNRPTTQDTLSCVVGFFDFSGRTSHFERHARRR